MRRLSLARSAARLLETERPGGAVAHLFAALAAPIAARGLVRQGHVPPSVAAIAIGGSTLGGSGKTRLAIACARHLAKQGARVVLVGHGYRSTVRSPRVVSRDDTVSSVGDEAVACARALGPEVAVVVARSRQAAIDAALRLSPPPDAIVLDGPLALGKASRSLRLLAVDAEQPWGSGRVFPTGDLRARPEALLALADHVVRVPGLPSGVRWPGESAVPVATLRGRRLGLFTAMARPDRLVRALAELGFSPSRVVSVADHGGGRPSRLLFSDVDGWLATEKCALHLTHGEPLLPVGILESDVLLPAAVTQALSSIVASRGAIEGRVP